MSPFMNWAGYLDVIRQEFSQAEEEQTKRQAAEQTEGQAQDKKTAIEILKQYCETLKIIEAQYQSAEFYNLIDSAYQQLDTYLNRYLELLSPDNAALFNREDPHIILYLGKRAALYRYPSAKNYLISIREEDVLNESPVWTSLAHELGHFVYWNSEFCVSGQLKQASVSKNFLFIDEIQDTFGVTATEMELISSENGNTYPVSQAHVITAFISAWSEEIFADTFGVYLAGEDFAAQSSGIYLKDLESKNPKRYIQDWDHPFAFLRPYIAAKALEEKMGVSNNLWRSLKDTIRKNEKYREEFLVEIGGSPDDTIADEDIALLMEVSSETTFEIGLESLKPAIIKAIALFAEKIKSSKPAGRENHIFEFIEEFGDGDPPHEDLMPGTKRKLRAWLGKIFKKLKPRKPH